MPMRPAKAPKRRVTSAENADRDAQSQRERGSHPANGAYAVEQVRQHDLSANGKTRGKRKRASGDTPKKTGAFGPGATTTRGEW